VLKINILLLMFLLVVTGCGGLVPKKYPQRSKGERFYDFTNDRGTLLHYRCDDNDGKKNCIMSTIDIMEEWTFFNHGKFIVIPESYCF